MFKWFAWPEFESWSWLRLKWIAMRSASFVGTFASIYTRHRKVWLWEQKYCSERLLRKLMTPRRSGDLQPQATYKWKPTRGNLLNSILRNCMIFLQSANAWLFHPDHQSRDGLPFQAGGGQRAIAPSCNQWTDPEKKPNCPLSRHSTATHKSNHFDLELNQNKQNSMQQTFFFFSSSVTIR